MRLRNTIFALAAAGCLAFGMVGCDRTESGIQMVQAIENSVRFPEQYSISYEVTRENGTVYMVEKTKDAQGNIYFQSGGQGMLFLIEGDTYQLYLPDYEGVFSKTDETVFYRENYVESVTEEFSEYAEKSRERLLPGIEEGENREFLNRDCKVYTMKLGNESNGVLYTLLADRETGICLSWEESAAVGGYPLESKDGTFQCVRFQTDQVPSLRELVQK